MANDVFVCELFNDGEGLDHNDLNGLARMGVARLTDQMLSEMVGSLGAAQDPQIGDNALTQLIYTMTGGCCVVEGASNTQLGVRRGTMFQRIAASQTGTESVFVPFNIDDNNQPLLTISAGDASNPRIDILQVKIEWESNNTESRDFKDATTGVITTTTPLKRRRVKATFSIKSGTAAATPTWPAPDSGYAVLAAVEVPATWTTGIDSDTGTSGVKLRLIQCSVPLGIRAITHTGQDFDYEFPNETGWRRGVAADTNSIRGSAYAASAGTALGVWCPWAGSTVRIVGIRIVAKWVTSGTVTLKWLTSNITTAYTATVGPTFSLTGLVQTGGTVVDKFVHLGQICDSSSRSNPSSADGVVGDPTWAANARSGPAGREVQQALVYNRAVLIIDGGSTSQIYSVTWYLAGGGL